MNNFKTTVEILSALASLIAICTVLYSWYRSSRKALRITRVLVHKYEKSNTYIIGVKNRKDHPVEIKETRCFTEENFKVEQKSNSVPEYSSILSYGNNSFTSKNNFTIEQNGHTDISFEAAPAEVNSE